MGATKDLSRKKLPEIGIYPDMHVFILPNIILDHDRLPSPARTAKKEGECMCVMCDETNYGSKIFICFRLLNPESVFLSFPRHYVSSPIHHH